MTQLSELVHDYDPVAAHEYYVRTRKLKGRKPGETPPTKSSDDGKLTATKTQVKPKVTAKVSDPHAAKMKSDAQARVTEMLGRLKELRAELERLVEQAKKRSGVVTPKKTTASTTASGSAKSSSSSTSKKDAKPLTPTQKKKRAEAEQKRRDKEKKASPQNDVQAKIDEIKDKIKLMQAQLAEAKQKALDAASNTHPVPKTVK